MFAGREDGHLREISPSLGREETSGRISPRTLFEAVPSMTILPLQTSQYEVDAM